MTRWRRCHCSYGSEPPRGRKLFTADLVRSVTRPSTSDLSAGQGGLLRNLSQSTSGQGSALGNEVADGHPAGAADDGVDTQVRLVVTVHGLHDAEVSVQARLGAGRHD